MGCPKMINKTYVSFTGLLFLIGGVWSSLCIAENLTIHSENERIFEYQETYPFLEQRYTPSVTYDSLKEKYLNASRINPYPEELVVFILDAMERGDYQGWLRLLTSKYREVVSAEDVSDSLIRKRKGLWAELLSSENEIRLTTLVQVGRAQYTYVMAIVEVSNKKLRGEQVINLYFPMRDTNEGGWRFGMELMEHPVFNRYIDNSGIYYRNIKSGADKNGRS